MQPRHQGMGRGLVPKREHETLIAQRGEDAGQTETAAASARDKSWLTVPPFPLTPHPEPLLLPAQLPRRSREKPQMVLYNFPIYLESAMSDH